MDSLYGTNRIMRLKTLTHHMGCVRLVEPKSLLGACNKSIRFEDLPAPQYFACAKASGAARRMSDLYTRKFLWSLVINPSISRSCRHQNICVLITLARPHNGREI